MFVKSIKTSKKKLIGLLCIVLAVVCLGIWALSANRGMQAMSSQNSSSSKAGAITFKGATNEERLDFLGHFGWQVESDPAEIVEFVIPAEFNDTYQNYNAIQKKQGLDLEKFKGKTAKRYSYTVTNYPNVKEGVRANLVVYKDKIIAGDICSLELDGFMHGFSPDTIS
ncbi:DUF4830 domain-containing protein [Zongyangia hominis]|uniref:DUF4830 domain-containing protein n=1 Tax=Zongyangia hominis TaxID=2763677 RepID=A0A926EDD6_9FIRM|nr:DUF4830 domain-containing protein [Zongyangia hominis]MBC8571015.1 DUF4830 domain-containing protein [Zongyangia hominis]